MNAKLSPLPPEFDALMPPYDRAAGCVTISLGLAHMATLMAVLSAAPYGQVCELVEIIRQQAETQWTEQAQAEALAAAAPASAVAS